MLKITAIGNLTNDVELKMNETTGKPYAILRIASDRRYKDMDALQDAYRKRLGQRLMSTIRDETGKREVLAASGGEYVIVDCCNDPQKLQAIRHRIQAQMNGLDVSAGKVRKRVRFLERFASWVRKETSDGAA